MSAFRAPTGFVVAAAFLAVGCSGGNSSARTVVHVSPDEFVSDDLKRLVSHLELSTGRVKLSREGPPMGLSIELETWKNGAMDRKLAGSVERSVPDDISVSAKQEQSTEGLKQYRVVLVGTWQQRSTKRLLGFIPITSTSTGSQSFSTDVTVPRLSKDSLIYAMTTLQQPAELTQVHPVAVWAILAGRGAGTHLSGETVEDQVARCEWALVVKLSLNAAK